MTDERRLSALRAYLRRTKTRTQLATLADSLYTADTATLEAAITSIGTDGMNVAGIARGIDRFDLLGVVEQLIAEMDAAGVTSWTTAESAAYARPLTVLADRTGHTAQL